MLLSWDNDWIFLIIFSFYGTNCACLHILIFILVSLSLVVLHLLYSLSGMVPRLRGFFFQLQLSSGTPHEAIKQTSQLLNFTAQDLTWFMPSMDPDYCLCNWAPLPSIITSRRGSGNVYLAQQWPHLGLTHLICQSSLPEILKSFFSWCVIMFFSLGHIQNINMAPSSLSIVLTYASLSIYDSFNNMVHG